VSPRNALKSAFDKVCDDLFYDDDVWILKKIQNDEFEADADADDKSDAKEDERKPVLRRVQETTGFDV